MEQAIPEEVQTRQEPLLRRSGPTTTNENVIRDPHSPAPTATASSFQSSRGALLPIENPDGQMTAKELRRADEIRRARQIRSSPEPRRPEIGDDELSASELRRRYGIGPPPPPSPALEPSARAHLPSLSDSDISQYQSASGSPRESASDYHSAEEGDDAGDLMSATGLPHRSGIGQPHVPLPSVRMHSPSLSASDISQYQSAGGSQRESPIGSDTDTDYIEPTGAAVSPPAQVWTKASPFDQEKQKTRGIHLGQMQTRIDTRLQEQGFPQDTETWKTAGHIANRAVAFGDQFLDELAQDSTSEVSNPTRNANARAYAEASYLQRIEGMANGGLSRSQKRALPSKGLVQEAPLGGTMESLLQRASKK